MTPKQALADLQKGKIWPVFFLYGEEPFKINEFIEKVKVALFGADGDTSFCIDKVDGAQSTGSEVLELIQSMGLFGAGGKNQHRLVIVKHATELKAVDSLSGALMSAKKDVSPWEGNVLILVAESLDGRRKFHQWLKKTGFALEFKLSSDAELLQWVDYLADKMGATVSPQARQLLCLLAGDSLYRLSNELEKAWLYAGGAPGSTIEEQHVSAVAVQSVSHQMVELVQACLAKKRTRALLLTQQLIQSSEDALGFVGFLTWALKHPFEQRVQSPHVVLEGLVQLDYQLKTSGNDPQTLVEQFIIEQA